MLNDFFAPFSTRKCSSHIARVAEGKGRDWGTEESPTVGDQVLDHLRNTKVPGPVEMHPGSLGELMDEVAKSLSSILEELW